MSIGFLLCLFSYVSQLSSKLVRFDPSQSGFRSCEGIHGDRGGEGPHFLNQLHEECHNRIRYKKTCPVHGEVPNDEIVMGYEYGDDQYAIIEPSEINQLRSERDRSVNIDKFVSPDEIDPIYYSGQTYYLLPDGKHGNKAYAVLQRAMSEEKVVGIAQVVISNKRTTSCTAAGGSTAHYLSSQL